MSVNLEFNYDEATSTMEVFSEGDIKEVLHWIQTLDKSKLVPKDLSDKQLVLFYNACHGNVNKTKVCIENYYSCRRNAPELFNNRDLKNVDLKIITESVHIFLFPGKCCKGYDMFYLRICNTDVTDFHFESLLKLVFMTIDICLTTRGPQPGFICFFDMKGLQLGHIVKTNPFALRKMFQYVQEALPSCLKGIHILNVESLLDKVLALLKPFGDKKFFDIIKFHRKDEDRDKLYEIVPRSSLPQEFGGTLSDTLTLHKQYMQQLQSFESYFKAEEEQRMAAVPLTTEESSMEGTFKQLEID